MNRPAPTPDELAGRSLHGDDFSQAQIDRWYDDEKEAYATMYADDSYAYPYRALDRLHAFSRLPRRQFANACGLGSAFGDEFAPIEDRIRRATIIESSGTYAGKPALSVPTEWVTALPSGDLALPDASMDLVMALSVLHHIPNVSHVARELARVTVPGGAVVVREPTVSMGDWSIERPGCTPRERGIPPQLLRNAFTGAGFEVRYQAQCVFGGTMALGSLTGIETFNNGPLSRLDAFASRIFQPNHHYHATSRWQRVRPTAMYLVMQRSWV